MDIFKSLKQLKSIQPDQDFSRRSLHLILNAVPAQAQRQTLKDMLWKSLEFAGAVALAGLLIFLITGGSSSITSPFQVANFDSATLKAEAHAIDMQIQLTNLDYDLVTSPLATSSSGESTPSVMVPSNGAPSIAPSVSAPQATSSVSGSASTTPLSVDQALDQLSK